MTDTILDRDKARTVLARSALIDMSNDEILDALEECARGVVLTPEEARLAAYGLRHVGDGTAWRKPEHHALAARLEAVS